MKILVTGATGFLGYEVARQLSAGGAEPRLLVRRPDRGALLRPLDAELVSGDLMSPASLTRAVEGVDCVIHLAARAAFESYRRVSPSIVGGSRALMKAAADAGVERFVYSSSLLVYGNQRAEIDPTTPAIPAVDYGRAKLEAERILVEEAERLGTRLAALRLPHVYGARDLLFERAHSGLVFMAGKRSNLFSHLHVSDAARVLIAAARQGWTGISPVADHRPTTWAEFAQVLEDHYPRVRFVRLPEALARLGTELLRPVVALRSRPSLYTPDTVVGWNLNLPVKPGTLWDQLGIQPAFPTIAEGIPAVLDDSVAFRWTHPHRDPLPY